MFKFLVFHIILIFMYISMIYPTFSIPSIKKRCDVDLKQFYTEYNVNPNDQNFKSVTSLSLYDDPAMNMQTMKGDMNKKMTLIASLAGKPMKNFDYAHDVIKVPDETKKKMWIVRTFIFYQLLVYVTQLLTNPDLYDQVYGPFEGSDFPYRTDIVPEMKNFKMGIFGSITPTSDIDIGIQYSGTTLTKPGLAYMVSRFESAFLIFTGLNSLMFDVETYADMMTLATKQKRQIGGKRTFRESQDATNRRAIAPTGNQALPSNFAEAEIEPSTSDYFYLDTHEFNDAQFKMTLICAATSMLRNAVLYHMDIKGESLTNEEIKNIVNNFTMEEAVKSHWVFDSFYQDIKPMLSGDWLEKAKPIVINYMTSSYDDGRKEYYNLVDIAERGKFVATRDLEALNNNPDAIAELIVNIGLALTYRMESYTCAPTVVHVVRILQASKEKAEKYKTLTPKMYCQGELQHLDPFCTIGKYGYALSCLEQIGYIYRFHNTYCVEGAHYNKEKCDKKLKKYVGRFENGYFFFIQYNNAGYSYGGGKKFTKEKFAALVHRKLKNGKDRSKKKKTRKRKGNSNKRGKSMRR